MINVDEIRTWIGKQRRVTARLDQLLPIAIDLENGVTLEENGGVEEEATLSELAHDLYVALQALNADQLLEIRDAIKILVNDEINELYPLK